MHPVMKELKWMFRKGLLMTLSQTFYSVMYAVTLAFCGHLGKKYIGIATLSILFFEVMVVSVENGLRWCTLALFAQAQGSNNKKRAGILLQRALLAATFFWLFMCVITLHISRLMTLSHQDEELSIGAGRFMLVMMPGALMLMYYRILVSLLDSLGRVIPTVFIQLIVCGCCCGLQYLFVFRLNLHITGAAIALTVSLSLLFVLMAVYLLFSDALNDCWDGWTFRAFSGWAVFYKTLVPGMLVFLSNNISLQLGNYMIGYIGTDDLIAQGICFQIYMMSMQFATGFGGCAVARMGQYFGSGDHIGASRLYKILLLFFCCTGGLVAMAVYFLRYHIMWVFNADSDVAAIFVKIVPFLALFIFISNFAVAPSATLRAGNFNLFIFLAAFAASWFIRHPIGVPLIFVANLGIVGLWLGVIVANICWFASLLFWLACKNWDQMCLKLYRDADRESLLMSIDNPNSVTTTYVTSTSAPSVEFLSSMSIKLSRHLVEDSDLEDDDLGPPNYRFDSQSTTSKTRRKLQPLIHKLPFMAAAIVFLLINILLRIFLPHSLPENGQFTNHLHNQTLFNTTRHH